MHSILSCVRDKHDHQLLALSITVCILGVYAINSVGAHARRMKDRER